MSKSTEPTKMSNKGSKASQTPEIYEKSVIQKLEDSRLRIRPWVLQLIGGIFIVLGIILIVYPLISDRVDINLPDFLDRKDEGKISSETVDEEDAEDVDGKEDSTDGETDEGKTSSDSTARIDTSSTDTSRAKSVVTLATINRTGKWRATNYVYKDIAPGSYEIKLGDTLWELSEAAYGDGNLWRTILDKNSTQVGFLPDGSQALIIPGQFLTIP